MKRLKLNLTVCILFMATVLFAQDKFGDKLIQRDGKIVVCQVREIGDNEIQYIQEGFRDDVVFGIDKNKLERIIFSDGHELKLSDSMFGKDNYGDQRKNALKFHFFSPLTGATAFSYERSLKPGSSIEAGVGIIGLGKETDYPNASGVYVNLGYKFIKDPDFYIKGMRYAHVLKGAYFKPELAFSMFNYKEKYYSGGSITGSNVYNTRMGAFILNIGKQWIFANRFLVDWSVGAGYGFARDGSSQDGNYFAFTGVIPWTECVVNSSFSIGFLY